MASTRLKRWVVDTISGLLSDYLEGIAEQNVQASLNLEVGQVEVRHVRIIDDLKLLREQRLRLLSSDVSVSARIPWRNLGSEPTVITVRNLWIEVEAEATRESNEADSAMEAEELQRWRARRRQKVEERIERSLDEDENHQRPGRLARWGHAALRQLQVHVDGLHARVQSKVPSYPVMDLSILRLTLHEGHKSPERLNVPKEVQRHPASLDKLLELVGLCAQLSSAAREDWPALRQDLADMQHRLERDDADSESLAKKLTGVKEQLLRTESSASLIGPLSLDARLWHSRSGGILWLQTELQVSPTAAAVCISPSNAQCISNAVNWYSEGFLPPGHEAQEKVQAPSGAEYAEMCARRAKGELLEDDQQRLDAIEDMAPIEWLARWQLAGTKDLRLAAPQPRPQGFAAWMQPWRSREAPTAGDDDEIIDDIANAAVEEAGRQNFLEEVEEPRRLEVRVLIPSCKILSCTGGSSDKLPLRIEGGVDCNLALGTARRGAMADFLRAAWDGDVRAKLSSIAVMLGEEPLMLLQRGAESQSSRPETRDDDDEFFDVQSDIEEEFTTLTTVKEEEAAAVNLLLHCSRFGGAADPNSTGAPWSFRVRLKQEPFRFMLAPTSTRNALTTVLSVARAVTLTRADPAVLPDADPKTPPVAGSSPKAKAAEGGDAQAVELDLDLDVAAPVFRWGLLDSDGHVTVALGRFLFRTSSHRPPQAGEGSQRCDWMKFACFCKLTETCVTVQDAESESRRVYEPTTMSLQAWRDPENAQHWRWSLESEAFRWNIGPQLMKVAGQLPVGLDYAMSPLRDVLFDASVPDAPPAAINAGVAGAASAATAEGPAETAKPKVQVNVSIMNTELVLLTASDQKVCLALEDIRGEYAGYGGRSEMKGEVGACHLYSEEISLVSFTRGASVQARNSDRHVSVTARSTLIAVQWYEEHIRQVLAAVDEAWEVLADGHERTQELLPRDNAGMFAQLWSRYIIKPIQVRVKQRAAKRLEELLPGHSRQETVIQEPAEEADPEPRGQCSVEVNLSGEGLTLVFPNAEGPAPHALQVAVSGAESSFRAFQSGDATAAVSLMTLTLELDGRILLMPRRRDKLLKVDILRRAHIHPALIWSASWAQVCILFRQRDYDRLVALVSSAIQGARPSRRRIEAALPDEEPIQEDETKEQERHGARFRLDVGAPLVFLPTDGRCLSHPRVGCANGYEGGQLEVDESGEPTFRPLRDEGFLVLDFGHVAASGAGNDTGVKLQLRGAQVQGMEPTAEMAEARRSNELLWPVSLQAVLETPSEGPVGFHAVSMDDGEGIVNHRMSLTRGQLTLLLDVLAENICYTGRSGFVADARQPAVQRQASSGNVKNKNRGFCFSWRWPGELKFDIAFTQAAPLGCLNLQGGLLSFSSLPERTNFQLNCQSLRAIDTRKTHDGSRSLVKNVVKTLLESSGSAGHLGFTVEVDVPVETDTLAVIELQKPTMHVLPQLVMDLVTAGLSSWQHCTWRNDRVQAMSARGYPPASGLGEAPKVDKRGTRIEVNFLDGCFRIAEKWSEPSEHFEFAGSVMIHMRIHAEGIQIQRFDLESGALRLQSSRRNPTTLCPCLEWQVRGNQKRVDDDHRMKRHTTYEFRSVIVPPYSIRMSARDHRAMANALLELLSMDAESAEPGSETQSRDPLVLQLVENRMTLSADVALQGAEVQVMGEEGGNEWPGLCGNARCQLLQVMVDSRQGQVPTVNIYGQELEVDISARNHRLGTWEPVLSRCGLKFSYHKQRKPDGGPRDVFIRGDVSATNPVQLVISAPFVHLASRVLNDSSENMRYGHLLAGVNISGMACHVSVEDSAEGLVLPSSAKAQSLDSLLKGRGPASTGSVLVLQLLDRPDSEACRIPYGREADVTWDTKTDSFLMCRLVMPRPPQMVLLITSTVCVWNRTPADLEIQFLAPSAMESSRLEPVRPTSAHLSIDARLLTEGVSGEARVPGSPVKSGVEVEPESEPSDAVGGTLRLGAGQLLSAPTAAQLRMGQAVLQLRPALTDGGVTYTWSEPFFAIPVATPNGSEMTVCSSPPPEMEDLPKNWLYLRTSCGGNPQEGWSNVEVHAPFTVVNACPCDILCQFNPPVQKHMLGKEKESLPVERGATIHLVVDNGFGGEVVVPNCGHAEVTPIRLDNEGYFRWTCNGQPGRTRPRWQNINSLTVTVDRQRAQVEWHCAQATMSSNHEGALRIPPQSILPAFEFDAEDLLLSFAVRDLQGHSSAWSFPLRAVLPTGATTETVQLVFKGMLIHLNATRSGRELVVYTRWWFVNSTGLDVRLLQPGGPGPMHPLASFNSKVSILPEIQNEAGDGVAYVGLRSHAPVEVIVPDVGGAVAVGLTPLHPCCLRTETVALREAMRGVPSCLVSLVPAMMLFNHTDQLEVGFRQQGCPSDTAVLVAPNSSKPLWWTSSSEQAMKVAARNLSDSTPVKRSWCCPFELQESRIGAYPVVLKCGPSRELVCICIDVLDAASLAVTVKDSSHCHMLINQHPQVQLTGTMEGVGEPLDKEGRRSVDAAYTFQAAYGEQVPFGGKGPPPSNVRRLRLTVRHATDVAQEAEVMIDLDRSGVGRVPLASGGSGVGSSHVASKRRSTLWVNAVVTVVLRNRVAVVKVAPNAARHSRPQDDGGDDAENEDAAGNRTFNGELHIDKLLVGLVIEGPSRSLATSSVWGTAASVTEPRQRREAFTIALTQVIMNVAQTPKRCRDVDFQISDIQVDLQSPQRDVILKSTSQPALRTHTKRDDIRMLDVHLREVELVFGNLEVSVTGALMDQARLLRRNLTVDMGGLTFEQVLGRAKGGILSNPQPPPASSKFAVSKLVVRDAKVDVWCQLHLPDAHYLPKSLRDTIQVVSLGATRLDIKGAQVKLPQQTLFKSRAAEGNTSIVLSKVWDHYLPLVKNCWRSLLQHSNIFLGGLLSRHTWNPRQRQARENLPPLCRIGSHGEIQMRG